MMSSLIGTHPSLPQLFVFFTPINKNKNKNANTSFAGALLLHNRMN